MADESDVTGEVARVLDEHYDGAIRMDAWVCAACGAALAMPSWNALVEGTTGPLLRKAMAKHQADLLAEAGLLREEHSNALAWDRGYTWGHNDSQSETETRNPYRPQIATQEPAGATQGGSGDSRASGGLGERLRALTAGPHPDVLLVRTAEGEWLSICAEADRMEEKRERQAQTISDLQDVRERLTGQATRVQALAQRFDDEGRTGIARLVREAVEG